MQEHTVVQRRGSKLRQLHDVHAPSPVQGQVLSYNEDAGKWEPGTASETLYPR